MNLSSYLQNIYNQSLSLLKSWGFSAHWAAVINVIVFCALAVSIAIVLRIILKRFLRLILIQALRRKENKFLHALLDNKLAHYVSILLPVAVFYEGIPIVFADFKSLSRFLITVCDIYFVFALVWIAIVILKAGADQLRSKSSFRDKPIESYVQVIRIVLYVIAVVALFSNLTGKSPVVFFTAMGAVSAVLLLMFKDVIMGMMASIQITTNDIVRIGDWITMPKYGADGDILEINLTTVKVQNFDKTITTIPTYSLISDSFQNWRGMRQSGGRRIKRAVHIKQSSIRFLRDDELPRFEQIQLLSSYIQHRQKDINKHNARVKADKSLLINGRNLTNAGLFRKYIDNYISKHSGTNKRMNIMVRQLEPTPHGLPIEVYVFANTIIWAEYEHIMADIFDHIIAAAPYFGLQIYEMEGSGDLKQIEIQNQAT